MPMKVNSDYEFTSITKGEIDIEDKKESKKTKSQRKTKILLVLKDNLKIKLKM